MNVLLCRGSRDYARAMRTMLTVLLMLAAPLAARADALDDYLNAPPVDETKTVFSVDDLVALSIEGDARRAFNKTIRKMYRPDCGCLTYLENGVVRTVRLPLGAARLKEFLRGMRDRRIIPFGPKGQVF